MEVSVYDKTQAPVVKIGTAAGVCYGNPVVEPYEKKLKRVKNCINREHYGVLEHATATWIVKGISRACANQLVRHRMASYNQQSQRYCKLDLEGPIDDWFIMPDKVFNTDLEPQFREALGKVAEAYTDALNGGIPAEDARAILPQNGTTTIVITMNMREFMHFMDLRMTPQAQAEIRELCGLMFCKLTDENDEWSDLLDLMFTKIREKELEKRVYANWKYWLNFTDEHPDLCVNTEHILYALDRPDFKSLLKNTYLTSNE